MPESVKELIDLVLGSAGHGVDLVDVVEALGHEGSCEVLAKGGQTIIVKPILDAGFGV